MEQALRENCWRIRRQYKTQFEPAFAGLGTKEKLKERVLKEWRAEGGKLQTIEELTVRARTVFATSSSQVDSLANVGGSTLLATEADPVLAKAIVGAKDVDISALIAQLRNSDWVSKGRHYAAESNGKCPFCQQSIPDGLLQQMEEFFDRTYIDQIQEVDRLLGAYRSDTERILSSLQQAADSSSFQFIEASDFNQLRSALSGLLQANISQLKKKHQEPSRVVTLSSTSDIIEKLNLLIQSANDRIKAHNELISNLSVESMKLTQDFWQFVVTEELREVVGQHNKATANLDKAIEGISHRKQQKEKELTKCVAEIKKLESEITSILPTAAAINDTLAAFGFDSFKLACAEQGQVQNKDRHCKRTATALT